MKPFISVIVPARNEEKQIARVIHNIQAQNYPEKEIIVVANDCKDNTAKVATELADIVIDTHLKGLSRAKNLGAAKSNGDMYVFLDADSLMEQGLLYLAANQIESGYNMGKARIRPLDDQRLRAKFTCFTGNLGNSITTNLPRMDSGNGAFTFSDVNLFEKINGFDTTVNVMIDVDFFIRAKTSGGKMSFITEKGIYTSMRRFMQRGYLRCTFEDIINDLNPSLISRSWDY
jgi:glycosyltransferase involved in cell wall biosynthesis